MVEVFKTDVTDQRHAVKLIDRIQQAFPGHTANFDLEDCDRILRIKCTGTAVQSSCIIRLLADLGYTAGILPDIVRPADSLRSTDTVISPDTV